MLRYTQVDVLLFSPGDMKLIKVRLTSNVLKSIKTLLESNDLSADMVEEIMEDDAKAGSNRPDRPIDWIQSHYFAATGKRYPFVDVWEELSRLRPAVTLQ